MIKTWKEVKEKEGRGKFADYGEILRKYWAEIKPKLQQKKPFDVEV